jgi:hypothetical protein
MKELTFKRKGVDYTPLTYWQVDPTSKIAIYQGGRGARPDLDFIVKHKEEGKRLRTPSHTHWIVDLIAKKQCAPNVIKGFIDDLIKIYDETEPFNCETSRDTYQLQYVNKLTPKYLALQGCGYYSVEVLISFVELFSKCEKQTPGAFMFRNLLVMFKGYIDGDRDFYQIVGYSKRV